MGSRRDRIANEKIIDFFVPAAYPIGSNSSGVFDLRNAPPVVGAPGGGAGREIITNMLLTLSIGAHGALAGWSFTVMIDTGDTVAALTNFVNSPMVTQAAATNDLYLMEIRDLQRYIQVRLIVGGHAFTCCLIGNAERSRREPVYQLGAELAMTYVKNPAAALTGP